MSGHLFEVLVRDPSDGGLQRRFVERTERAAILRMATALVHGLEVECVRRGKGGRAVAGTRVELRLRESLCRVVA